jgi:hypothetical protein
MKGKALCEIRERNESFGVETKKVGNSRSIVD